MDGTLYTIVDDEDLVDAIVLDADKAIGEIGTLLFVSSSFFYRGT